MSEYYLPILPMLTLVLAVIKLAGGASFGWAVVFAPLWLPVAMVACVVCLIMICAVCVQVVTGE